MKKSIDNPYDLFNSNKKQDTLKSFSDELLELKGSLIELYLGDQAVNMEYDECSIPQNASIYGKLIEVLDRFVVLECLFVDRNNALNKKNKVYINTFQIRAMTVLDDKGSLKDIFLNVKDADLVKKLYNE